MLPPSFVFDKKSATPSEYLPFQPAVMEDLRRWTSDEALGDVTVGTNCTSHIAATFSDGDQTDGGMASDEEALDHKLPSPEEQLQTVALRYLTS